MSNVNPQSFHYRSRVTVAAFLLLIITSLFANTSRAKTGTGESLIDAANPTTNFEIQKLADGVYGVIRKDPPGLMVDANDVFIINDNDVIVVDTNGAPSITKEVLAALRKLTNKPVSYVINTHWHDDHIRGNQVYRDAYPGVQFIAHATMRDYMQTQGVINRKGFLEGAPQFLNDLKDALAKNKSIAGWDLTEEERTSYKSDISLVDFVLSESARAETVLPTITIDDRLTLYRGDRVIDIRHLGNGHTKGDLIVHLPKEGILITGDLVVWPVPLVGGDQSYVGDWSKTLEKMRELHPTTIVPGHGQVLHDDSYLKITGDLFASIDQQTKAAIARGETIEQARKSVKVDELKKQIIGDSSLRKVLFSIYVLQPSMAAVYREASPKK